VVVVLGRACEPGAAPDPDVGDCPAKQYRAARLDLASREWREVAAPRAGEESEVGPPLALGRVGDRFYFQLLETTDEIWSYDLPADRWSRVELPFPLVGACFVESQLRILGMDYVRDGEVITVNPRLGPLGVVVTPDDGWTNARIATLKLEDPSLTLWNVGKVGATKPQQDPPTLGCLRGSSLVISSSLSGAQVYASESRVWREFTSPDGELTVPHLRVSSGQSLVLIDATPGAGAVRLSVESSSDALVAERTAAPNGHVVRILDAGGIPAVWISSRAGSEGGGLELLE
jgi:hypothetical protein